MAVVAIKVQVCNSFQCQSSKIRLILKIIDKSNRHVSQKYSRSHDFLSSFERAPVAAGHVAPKGWEPHQNKFIGNVFHIIQTLSTLSSQSGKLKPELRQFNGFRNHIMWWRGMQITFSMSPAYQEFKTAGKQTSQCKVRRLLARRVLVFIINKDFTKEKAMYKTVVRRLIET